MQALEPLRKRKSLQLSYGTLEKARTAWDWILPALVRNRAFEELLARYELPLESENPVGELPGDFRIRVIGGEELVCAEVESQVCRALQKEKMEQFDREKVYDPSFRQELEERFSYRYPYQGDREIPVKLTVSQLKGREPEEDLESISLYPDPVTPAVPGFLQKEETLKGADRGTAYHRVLECLDFTGEAEECAVRKQMERMRERKLLTEEAYQAVRPGQIAWLMKSGLGRRMRAAQEKKNLVREQPFVLDLPASEQDSRWSAEETILIQGVIDAYFYEGDDLVLVDYKTDYLEPGKERELTEKYEKQLFYYARALERLTGKQVKEKYIYSFGAGKALPVGER